MDCSSFVCPGWAATAHTFVDASSKGHEKHQQLTTNAVTHLGALEGVDQTALADVREANHADGDALGCARFVCLEEAKQGGCRARSEIRPLMRARGSKRERRRCVAEVFEPRLGIFAWHQIYARVRPAYRTMSMTRETQTRIKEMNTYLFC